MNPPAHCFMPPARLIRSKKSATDRLLQHVQKEASVSYLCPGAPPQYEGCFGQCGLPLHCLPKQYKVHAFVSVPRLCTDLFCSSTAGHDGSQMMPVPQALVKISKAPVPLDEAASQAPPPPRQEPSQARGAAAAAKPPGTIPSQPSSPGASGQGSILRRPESQRDSKAAAALPSSPSQACRGSGSAATAPRSHAISTIPVPDAPLAKSMCVPSSGQASCQGRRHRPIVFSPASAAGQAKHSGAGGAAVSRKGPHVPISAADAAASAPAKPEAASADGKPTSPAGARPTADAATTQQTATSDAREEAERILATMAQQVGAPIVSAAVGGAETAAPAPAGKALSPAAQLLASGSPAGPAPACQQLSQLPGAGPSLPFPAPVCAAQAPNQSGWADHVRYHGGGEAQATAEDEPAKAPADDSGSGIAPFTFADFVAL